MERRKKCVVILKVFFLEKEIMQGFHNITTQIQSLICRYCVVLEVPIKNPKTIKIANLA